MYEFDRIIDRRGKNSAKWDSRLIGEGEGQLLPFWVADTDFAAPKEVQEALQKCVDHNLYGYSLPPKGCAGAVADWQERRNGFFVKEEWVGFIGGIDSGLAAAVCACTEPGDGVLIQPPVYGPFFETIEKNGRKVLASPLIVKDGRYVPDFEDFEKKAEEAKLFMLCNPQNPTGRCFTREELWRLARICLEHGVTIVSDEIHGDIVFQGHTHIPVASLSPQIGANTITFTSAAKTFSLAGLSASAVIISDEGLRRRFDQEKEKRCLNTGILGLVAMEAAYRYGDAYRDELLAYLQENRDFAIGYLRDRIPELHLFCPEGTFLLWLDCSALLLTGEELDDFFKEAGVKLGMGSSFRPETGVFARMNFACPRAVLKEGLNRMEKAVANRRLKMMEK